MLLFVVFIKRSHRISHLGCQFKIYLVESSISYCLKTRPIGVIRAGPSNSSHPGRRDLQFCEPLQQVGEDPYPAPAGGVPNFPE
jgi:hypothetical protein